MYKTKQNMNYRKILIAALAAEPINTIKITEKSVSFVACATF